MPYNLGLRLMSGWDAPVLGGLPSFVLPDAAVLHTVLIVGFVYVGWVNASTVWADSRRPIPDRREAS